MAKRRQGGAMPERRALVEGLKPNEIDPEVAQRFIRGDFASPVEKAAPESNSSIQTSVSAPHSVAHKPVGGQQPPQTELPRDTGSRLPLTIRVRSDFAAALKRASLERQLNGVLPNTLQDILEEALEPWLRSNGYLN